jgi:hypothetical protein
MYGRQHWANTDWRAEFQYLTALLRDLKRSAQESPGRSGSQDHDQVWIHQCQLRFQPRQARFDVAHLRCGVNSTLASFGEAKMLDGIGDVDLLFGNASLVERILKQPPGWSDKRNALAIFDVSGLLPDER